MSFKPIEESVDGVACAHCWGAGKTFGDIPTPKRVYLTGSGFAGACAICNGTFIAEQDLIIPCLWKFEDATRGGYWWLTAIDSTFSMWITGGANCYFKAEGVCVITSTDAGKSVVIAPAGPPTPEWKIAFDQNFAPTRETVYKDHGAVGADEVLQLANRLDRINLYAKYAPDY